MESLTAQPPPFDAASRVEGGGGEYRAVIDQGYTTAMGPFGGYLATLALRAAAAEATKMPPTELSCHFLTVGEPGPVEISVTRLHTSRKSECLGVAITQGDRAILSAHAWFNDARSGIDYDADPIPHAPPPSLVAPLEVVHERFAGFWFVETRPIYEPSLAQDWPAQPPPWSRLHLGDLIDEASPSLRAWVRLRPQATFDDSVLTIARSLVSVDWCIPFVTGARHAGRRGVLHSTQSLTTGFHHPAANDEWLYCEARARIARSGIAFGQAEVWSADGKLVAAATEQMVQRVRL